MAAIIAKTKKRAYLYQPVHQDTLIHQMAISKRHQTIWYKTRMNTFFIIN